MKGLKVVLIVLVVFLIIIVIGMVTRRQTADKLVEQGQKDLNDISSKLNEYKNSDSNSNTGLTVKVDNSFWSDFENVTMSGLQVKTLITKYYSNQSIPIYVLTDKDADISKINLSSTNSDIIFSITNVYIKGTYLKIDSAVEDSKNNKSSNLKRRATSAICENYSIKLIASDEKIEMDKMISKISVNALYKGISIKNNNNDKIGLLVMRYQ